MFSMEPKFENNNVKPIGQLQEVIVRVTHDGTSQDFSFTVSPNAKTTVVDINLDAKSEGIQ